MKVSPLVLFKKCYGSYAIAAVNVFTMEQVLGLFRAGQIANAPFIVQMTPLARNYAGKEMLLAMIDAAAKMYSKTVYAIHLDHGDEQHALDAILSNVYNSVMIDASKDNFETNVKRTQKIVNEAHKEGIVVEAELGVLSGIEDHISVDEKWMQYTQPSDVEEFVKLTQCDSLAIAIGTSHGAYKFKGNQRLRFDILEAIQERLPSFPLVLHGGSAIDSEEVKRINQAGGKLNGEASGVSSQEIKKSISFGICKINIATDTRLLWTRVHREFFKQTPNLFDPTIPGSRYIDAYEAFMLEKFNLFNATGKADQFIQ